MMPPTHELKSWEPLTPEQQIRLRERYGYYLAPPSDLFPGSQNRAISALARSTGRQLQRLKSVMRQLWKWLMIGISLLLLLFGLLTFPLPLPIGLPLFLIGVGLLVRHSAAAKRRLHQLKRRYPKLRRLVEGKTRKSPDKALQDRAG